MSGILASLALSALGIIHGVHLFPLHIYIFGIDGTRYISMVWTCNEWDAKKKRDSPIMFDFLLRNILVLHSCALHVLLLLMASFPRSRSALCLLSSLSRSICISMCYVYVFHVFVIKRAWSINGGADDTLAFRLGDGHDNYSNNNNRMRSDDYIPSFL